MKNLVGMLALSAGLVGCKDDDDDGDGHDTDTHETDDTDPSGCAEPFSIIGDETNLPATAFLSLWMSSNQDVFIAGADDGTGPAVVHYDGSAWSRLETGTTDDLWWV